MTTLIVPRRLLRSEWIKLRSLRSTYLIVGLAVAFGLGVGALDLATTAHNWHTLNQADRTAFDPVGDSLAGFQFAELAFGALGVLAISSEYATGTIQPTLTATPRRGILYAAKVLVVGAAAFVLTEVCTFAAFLIGQRVLSARDLGVGLSDPGVLRAVGCAGLYLTVVTLVGLGLGGFIRHTAGAITSMVALVFLSWPLARAVESFSYLPDRWLLVNAADALVSTHPSSGAAAARTPSLAMAFVELVVYLVVFLGVGAWRCTRDP